MDNFEAMGRNLDTLINTDMVGRGIISFLYSAAHAFYEKPLTYLAAEKIKQAVNTGDSVIITTGFRTPPLFIQETDGPFGAASLARSIDIALGGKVVLVTEPEQESINILSAACRGAGLSVVPLARLLTEACPHGVAVIGFTTDESAARVQGKNLLDEVKPKVMIAIEKAGRNAKGIYHNQGAMNISAYHSKVEYFLEEGKSTRGIPTIGIGDGGNEVGMGVVEETVRKFIDHGDRCKCPCSSGIAAHFKADILVTADVSNWGAYAIAGLIAGMSNRPEALHSLEHEENMFLFSMMEGAIDGDKGVVEKSCDNMDIDVHKAVLTLIRQIIFHNSHPVVSGNMVSI